MRRTIGLFCVGLCLAVTGCQKSAPPPGKGVGVDALCREADGERVRISGYVRYERGMFSSCDTFSGHKTCNLSLYSGAEAPPDFDVMHPVKGPEPLHARLSVPVGDSPGEMKELPEKFTASDVALHLADKATATEGGHVTLDGKLSVVPGDPKAKDQAPSCFVNVEWALAAQ